jgi:hypothetical protein
MRTCLLVFALSIVLSGTAAAEPTLLRAEQEYGALDYAKAAATAHAVLDRGGNDLAMLRRIYALLGQSLAITGATEEAKRFFQQLLALQPDYKLPSGASPKIRAPLAAVLADWAGRPGLTAAHRPPAGVSDNDPLVLKVTVIEDPLKMVHAARVTYQLPGKKTSSSVKVEGRGPDLVAAIPLPALNVQPGELSYRMELLDRSGNILFSKGTPAAPLTVVVTARTAGAAPAGAEAAGTPWYKRWWVWTIAGAVVAGAATAVVVTSATPDASKVALEWEVSP